VVKPLLVCDCSDGANSHVCHYIIGRLVLLIFCWAVSYEFVFTVDWLVQLKGRSVRIFFASLHFYAVKVKFKEVKLYLSTHWKHRGVAEVSFHSLLASALDGCDWLTSRPKKESRYPLNSRLDGSQSRSGRFDEDKISNPGRPTLGVFAMPTKLPS